MFPESLLGWQYYEEEVDFSETGKMDKHFPHVNQRLCTISHTSSIKTRLSMDSTSTFCNHLWGFLVWSFVNFVIG